MPFVLKREYLLTGNSQPMSFSPVICAVLAIGIVAGLVVTGFFVMEQIADASVDSVNLIVQLSGDDIVVTILEGEDTEVIVSLCVYIEGTPKRDRTMIVENPPIGKPILFKGLARERTGYAFVISETTFSDGTTKIIDYSRIHFS